MSRGTDSTGIAYVQDKLLQNHKEPRAADEVTFAIPKATEAVMIHTRLGTVGDSEKNFNNHPFFGQTQNGSRFALAHNGVIHNADELRNEFNLPNTEIRTDSYVAVQLLNQETEISFDTLGKMAEKIQGPFVFTVLQEDGTLWVLRGDNPLSMLQFPLKDDIIIYGSTDEILYSALIGTVFFDDIQRAIDGDSNAVQRINIEKGQILKIQADGKKEYGSFNYIPYIYDKYVNRRFLTYHSIFDSPTLINPEKVDEAERINILRTVAHVYGYSSSDVDDLLLAGFSPDEIEDELFCE
jgi:glucosamine--fructose-6-phosphate aminotransferase (isomerizing)